MNGRRAVVGLCMLCALAFSAFAAQGATAATKGTTAVTCKNVGANNGKFTKEHCRPVVDVGTGSYEHVPFAANTTTELIGTNEKTKNNTTEAEPSILKETIGGVELELKAPKVSGSGTMENKLDASGEHYAEGSGTIVYSEVEVTKPAGKGCEVFTDEENPVGSGKFVEGAKGVIDAKVKATTKGQGDFVKFEPQGTAFATFWVTCTINPVPALEGTWEITGSIKCPTDGATILCKHTETTTQNTLKGKGNKAGLEGALTLLGRDPVPPDTVYTPLSVTTVETP
jgi:hypothetical protein